MKDGEEQKCKWFMSAYCVKFSSCCIRWGKSFRVANHLPGPWLSVAVFCCVNRIISEKLERLRRTIVSHAKETTISESSRNHVESLLELALGNSLV